MYKLANQSPNNSFHTIIVTYFLFVKSFAQTALLYLPIISELFRHPWKTF